MPANQMNTHHFSYPVVVPLRGLTISGHSTLPPAPVGTPDRVRPLRPLVIRSATASAPAGASLGLRSP